MAEPNSICRQTSCSPPIQSAGFKLLILMLSFITITQQQCCLKFFNSKCIECPIGTRLYLGSCLFDIPNCIRYTGGFYCTKCRQGFELMDDNTCRGLVADIVVKESDITLEGFKQLTRMQILLEQGPFSIAFNLLLSQKDIYKYNKQQLIHVYTKPITIFTQPIQVYRIIAQTKSGFDDTLFTFTLSANSSSVIKRKTFDKITKNVNYEYVDLKAQQVHEFIISQIADLDEFVKEGRSIFDQSEEMIAYVVESQVGNVVVNSFVIYFANKNHGLIEVGFDLELYVNENGSSGANNSSAGTNSTTDSTSNTTSNSSANANSTDTNNNSNNNPNNSNNNPSQNHSSSPPVPSDPNIVYLRSLLAIFNYTSVQNYKDLPGNSFSASPLAPIIINFLVDNHPTLAKIYQQTNQETSEYLIDASYKILTVRQILIMLKEQALVVQETIDQLEKNLSLNLLVCAIFRLTYEIDQLQPYQIKLIAVTNLVSNQSLTPKTTDSELDPSQISLMRIVQQIGRPQTTYIVQTLVPSNDLDRIMISYPPQQQQFIQRVQFFLQMQYPQVMQNVKLLNVTYQQVNKPSHEIKNLSLIKDLQLRRIEEKNMFRSTYRVYVFVFWRAEGETRTEYRWKVMFKDNQLELIEVPEEVAEPYSGIGGSGEEGSSGSPSQNNQTNRNQNNQTNNLTNTSSNNTPSNNTPTNSRPSESSTLSQTSQQQIIYNNLFTNESTPVSDKQIIQLQKLIKSFYSGLLSSSAGNRYNLALVGLQVKSTVTTTITLNPSTNISSTNVTRSEDEKQFRMWYVLTRFNRVNASSNSTSASQSVVIYNGELDNQRVFGFQLGVNMRGLVTLYKVNVVKRAEFAISFGDYIAGRVNAGSGGSSVQTALKEVLFREDHLEPDVQSFMKYLQLFDMSDVKPQANVPPHSQVENDQPNAQISTKPTYQSEIDHQLPPNLQIPSKQKPSQSVQEHTQSVKQPSLSDKQSFPSAQPINASNQSQTNQRPQKESPNPQNESNMSSSHTKENPQESLNQPMDSNHQQSQTNLDKPITNPQKIIISKNQTLLSYTQSQSSIIDNSQKQSSSTQKPASFEKPIATSFENPSPAIQQQPVSPLLPSNEPTISPLSPPNESLSPTIPSNDVLQIHSNQASTFVKPQPQANPPNASFTSMAHFRQSDHHFNKLISFIRLIDPTKQFPTDNDIEIVYRVQLSSNNYWRYLVVFNKNINSQSESKKQLAGDSDDNDTLEEESPLNVFELEIENLLSNGTIKTPDADDDTAGEVVILSINDDTKEKEYKRMIESSNTITQDPNDSIKTNNTAPVLTEYYYYSKYSTQLSTSAKGAASDGQITDSLNINGQDLKKRVLQTLLDEIKAQEKDEVAQTQPVKTPQLNIVSGMNPNDYPTISSIKGQSLNRGQNLRKQPAKSTSNIEPFQVRSPVQPQTSKWLGLLQVQPLATTDQPTKPQTQATSSFSKRFHQVSPGPSSSSKQLYKMTTVLLQLPTLSDKSTKKTSSTADAKQFAYPNFTISLSLHQFVLGLQNDSKDDSSDASLVQRFKVFSSDALNRRRYRFGKMLSAKNRLDQYIGKIENDPFRFNAALLSSSGSILLPRHVALLDPYFKASQRFVIWDNSFFLKKHAQTQITLTFDQQSSNTQSLINRQAQLRRLISNLQSCNASNIQSLRHLAQFHSFMANNFKSVIYTVEYLVANYDKESVDKYVIATRYNDMAKRYDVAEMKIVSTIPLKEIHAQQNFILIDPALNCQQLSKESKLKCTKCNKNYLLTNFSDLFSFSQDKLTYLGTPTACSKKISHCKYQFMEACFECDKGYEIANSDTKDPKRQNSKLGEKCIKKV